MSNRTALAASLLLASTVAACTADKADVDEDFTDLAAVDQKSDYFSYRLKLLGTLHDGDNVRARYSKTPNFRGFDFTAAAGDQVDVWVKSTTGDALTWVLDGKFRVIGKNDDANADTYDSHLALTLPASGVPGNTYYVVFRDYDLATRYFNVSLTKPAATPIDPAWRGKARAEVARLVDAYAPLAALAVPVASLPPAARARVDASAAVLEVPTAYKVTVDRRPFYLIVATDGSGEGNLVVLDLIDSAGTWFDHGVGHVVWDGGGFGWTLDDADPTMCKCTGGAGTQATCTWMDGTSRTSTEITCE